MNGVKQTRDYHEGNIMGREVFDNADCFLRDPVNKYFRPHHFGFVGDHAEAYYQAASRFAELLARTPYAADVSLPPYGWQDDDSQGTYYVIEPKIVAENGLVRIVAEYMYTNQQLTDIGYRTSSID